MKLTPGDRVNILVNGEPVTTIIDDNGTQRFIENGVVRWLVDANVISLNDMCLAYHKDQFNLDDYMEFYMSLGYSVCGFEEIFGEGSGVADRSGAPVDILNPVWEREIETVH